ncbi:MAG: hypothetical protein AAGF73_17995 [Actinomycetota bacterium]
MVKQLRVTAGSLALTALLANCAAPSTAHSPGAELSEERTVARSAEVEPTATASPEALGVDSHPLQTTLPRVEYGPADYAANYIPLEAVHTDEQARNFVLQTAYEYTSTVNNSVTGELHLGYAAPTPELLNAVAGLADGTSMTTTGATANTRVGLLTMSEGSFAPLRGGPPGAQPSRVNGRNLLVVFDPWSELRVNTIIADIADALSILDLVDVDYSGPVQIDI